VRGRFNKIIEGLSKYADHIQYCHSAAARSDERNADRDDSRISMPIIIILDDLCQYTDRSSVVQHLLEPTMGPASIADMMLMPTTDKQVYKFVLMTQCTPQPPYISTIDMDVHDNIHKFVDNKVTIMRTCGDGTHLR
jgi:hypothetical protein